jgi:hypothetical protein
MALATSRANGTEWCAHRTRASANMSIRAQRVRA